MTLLAKDLFQRFTRSHYRQFDLGKNFSSKIFNRYLNLLDYSHNIFYNQILINLLVKSKVGQT